MCRRGVRPPPAGRGRDPSGRFPTSSVTIGGDLVALVYFDSSALVKLVLEEPGTQLAAELWDACDGALSSRLAYPEVRAVLAASARNHELDADELLDAERAWEEFWGATRKVELTADVEQNAGRLARSPALRGADAVHLASALAIADDDLIVAVWDRRLHGGVLASGIRVAPGSLDVNITVAPRQASPAGPPVAGAAGGRGAPPAEPTG